MTRNYRLRIVTLGAAFTALLFTAAFAKPYIGLDAMSAQPGTVGSFLQSHATGSPASMCYQAGLDGAGSEGAGAGTDATGRIGAGNNYTCFEHAVQLSGMAATLSGAQPVTVFAPTDAAFAHLESTVGMGAYLKFMANPAAMKRLVDASIVAGSSTLPDLAYATSPATPSTSLITMAGTRLQVAFGTAASATTTSSATVDVGPSNGVDGQSYVSGTPAMFPGSSVLIPIGRISLGSLSA